MKYKRLPEAELEIMLVLWESEGQAKSDYIMEKMKKDWVKPTLLNLLSRLEERGFVEVTKQGRNNVYNALVDREEYLEQETAGFLDKLYSGSLKKMVATLYDGKKVSKSDLAELEEYIKSAK